MRLGAVGVAVRVAVGVAGGRVVAVGLPGRLDPHIRLDRVARPVRLDGRAVAEAGAVDVAPVAAERPLVHLVGGDVVVDVGGAGVERGRAAGAAPAVAGQYAAIFLKRCLEVCAFSYVAFKLRKKMRQSLFIIPNMRTRSNA